MRWQHIKTVYLKEIMDTVRDKRTLYVMILVPLILMPVLTMIGPYLGQRETQKTQETVYNIVVQGEQNSPVLADIFKKSPKFKVVNVDKPEDALKKGDIQAILQIPADFNKSIQEKKKANLKILYQGKDRLSDVARLQVSGLVGVYGKQLVSARLAEKGLQPDILEPLDIKEQNMATQEEMGGVVLSMMLPIFIIVWAIVGGMYTAIDLGAGEKERGTMESLLLTPPDRKSIVTGKYLAIVTVANITIILALFSMVASMQILLPIVAKKLGAGKISLPPGNIALILLIAFSSTSFLCALELAISTFARSFKEAQNYITPLYIVALIPAMVIQFLTTFKPPQFLFVVPVMNTILVLRELFAGTISWQHIGLTVISTIVVVRLSIGFVFKTFNKEKVLFRT